MLQTLSRLALCAAAFAAATSTKMVPAAETDIVGTYDCVGTNADGGTYEGITQISKEGDAYNFKWTIAGITYYGIALRDGDSIACSWVVEGTGGIVVYKIEGKKLVGKWSQFGTNGVVLKETLTKQ
jgi:hypothetical protein